MINQIKELVQEGMAIKERSYCRQAEQGRSS